VAWAVARAALGNGYPSVRCTTSAKSNSAPPQRGGGAAAGRAAGGVADRRVGHSLGSSGRRCGQLRGQPQAALWAATQRASGGAACCLLDSNGGGGSRCGVRRGHIVQGIRLRVNIEKNH
jgi:hypothetical protein